jgi:RNA polymerase sigma-70 factor (ECF subfamily)
VHACADKLPEKVARVFLLREVEQWEAEQICETMNIKRTHLFVMLHRARLALRHCLERNWFARSSQPPLEI